MTRTELERLSALEERTSAMCDSIDRVETKLDQFIAAADGKYASKLVERVVYGMVALTLSAALAAILALIMR